MSVGSEVSELLGVAEGTTLVLLAVAGVLLAGLLKRGIAVLREEAAADDIRRWRSVCTWSALLLVLVAVVSLGRAAVVVCAGGVSLLALREGLRLAGTSGLYVIAAPASAALYLWAWADWTGLFLRGVPLLAAAWLVVELAERARTQGGLSEVVATGRALLLTVVGPSFVVAVASLPAPKELPDADMGGMVLLVLLTAVNDSAQAWWGRSFGRRQMAPRISPAKTWLGLLGGVATTTAASVALAPTLTAWGRQPPPTAPGLFPPLAWPVLVGLLIGLAGTAGDLSASVLKRRAGVDDSGTALPGHGGWIDRFDSLAVSAPVYFSITWSLWYAGHGW